MSEIFEFYKKMKCKTKVVLLDINSECNNLSLNFAPEGLYYQSSKGREYNSPASFYVEIKKGEHTDSFRLDASWSFFRISKATKQIFYALKDLNPYGTKAETFFNILVGVYDPNSVKPRFIKTMQEQLYKSIYARGRRRYA